MTAFDPATIQLQRELLATTTRDLDQARRVLARQPKSSKSKMAERLRDRIATGERVIRDLRGLIRFMEGLNQEQDAETGTAEHDPAAAEVLSTTPLATAFGAATDAETGGAR